jgi:hypothetical protein
MMAQAKFCARVMDDWYPPRCFDALEEAHKDRFRYGSGASTLYAWQSGRMVARLNRR